MKPIYKAILYGIFVALLIIVAMTILILTDNTPQNCWETTQRMCFWS